MPKTLIKVIAVFCTIAFSFSAYAQEEYIKASKQVKSKDWTPILDEDLSEWEVFTGVPESTVENLPKGYKKTTDGKNKEPIGLGDPMGIFKVITDENGEPILHISGEVYAGLTSKKPIQIIT
ncbi:MAG: hypothetical protein ACI9IP_000058 [Arcticibacterium sp.]|jgi:hypothetical protein